MIDTDDHDPDQATFVAYSSFDDVVREAAGEALGTPELIDPGLSEGERVAAIARLRDLRALLVRLLDAVTAGS